MPFRPKPYLDVLDLINDLLFEVFVLVIVFLFTIDYCLITDDLVALLPLFCAVLLVFLGLKTVFCGITLPSFKPPLEHTLTPRLT